ncbi:MAG: iron-sulfur cluster assembly accessory protein [Deltaproteobacteria bacterium]|nr:iron-sulfur cluster assembly accessory protein [Deltaproteobacteria bacterium]
MTSKLQEESHTVVLTEKAAQVVREAFESEKVDLEKAYLRIGARPGGCSGYRFEMDYADESQVDSGDEVFSHHGVKVVINRQVLNDVMGSVEIDYQSGNMVEQGFKFRRLVDGALCGCGESFSPVKPQEQ